MKTNTHPETKPASAHTPYRPADLDFVKEALRIVNTGRDSKGNSFNNLGRLNQAAFIGEHSGALIAEIEHLREVKADLLKTLKDIQHNAQVMNQAEPNRVWTAIDDQCRAALSKAGAK